MSNIVLGDTVLALPSLPDERLVYRKCAGSDITSGKLVAFCPKLCCGGSAFMRHLIGMTFVESQSTTEFVRDAAYTRSIGTHGTPSGHDLAHIHYEDICCAGIILAFFGPITLGGHSACPTWALAGQSVGPTWDQ